MTNNETLVICNGEATFVLQYSYKHRERIFVILEQIGVEIAFLIFVVFDYHRLVVKIKR